MGRLFGTDGVRGRANVDLTAEIALDLSVAAAHVLGDLGAFSGHRPIAIVGQDSRASGEFLQAAVVAGLASAGVDVKLVGIAPTPAVAFLVAQTGADLGVMLSASHNPMPDNGIKFFARGGVKLADEVEDLIEARMGEDWSRPTGSDVGRVIDSPDLLELYIQHVVETVKQSLAGLKVVVDAANGAASFVAPEIYRRAGAEVIEIHCSPNGTNINENCGSTHMEDLQLEVVKQKADIGVAHDGDADRFLAVDAKGEIVDGDQIMAVLAVAKRDAGTLKSNTVVSTVMANLGFKIAMQNEKIEVVETAVGDRYVLEAMRDGGYNFGGEQSGHVILSEFATTGDGALTALQLMSRMALTKKPLSELAAVMTKLPQVLINVKNVDKHATDSNKKVQSVVKEVESVLGNTGRVLLRPSGTEPVVRVMVEAATKELALEQAQRIVDVVALELAI
ncbi:MAG: phosphoglucosamine mutase [Actinobacteria bacterium]|nr:phosphoglucosamine mutase [Actinomycetota bacterium]